MHIKQTISIIGSTGNMGSALAKSLAKGNYRLLLCPGKHTSAKSLARDIMEGNPAAEVEAVDCSYDASWEADIIINAVPYEADKETAAKIGQVATQKIVISISNPLNATRDGLLTSSGSSAGEELQKLLPNSKVIKAFNTMFAGDFSQPAIDGKSADSFIAGNDPEALLVVAELVKTAGFNPVIAGDLSVSRKLEQRQLMLIQLNAKSGKN